MAKMGDFCAFSAAIELLKESGRDDLIQDVYRRCKEQQFLPKEEIVNCVKDIYRPFTVEQISAKVAAMLCPDDIRAEVEIVFQTIEYAPALLGIILSRVRHLLQTLHFHTHILLHIFHLPALAEDILGSCLALLAELLNLQSK